VNTFLYSISTGGVLVNVKDRMPESVCAAIARHKVDLLPTTPSFLNLFLLSGAQKRHDISSLKRITYGTEVMHTTTLSALHSLLPQVTLHQTYGLSELGVLRTKSKSSDSKWVRVGGEHIETKVHDGTLWIRTPNAMLGYLNAPNPFDSEGWYNTEDMVEVDGDYFRFHGRKSEVINVGGLKVFPGEVEEVLMQMPEIMEACIHGEKNALFGSIIVATIRTKSKKTNDELRKSIRAFCLRHLARHKIPGKFKFSQESQYGLRFKKLRRNTRNSQG